MALASPRKLERYNGLEIPDGKTAKNAIAKAAKALRGLFTGQQERIDVLVQKGLLRHKNFESLIKELQLNVERQPSLFWVLLDEISKHGDGTDATRKLEAHCPPIYKKVPAILDDLREHLNVLKDIDPADDVIKAAVIKAVAKELKKAANVKLITDELSKLHQDELISSELLKWAITETQKEHRQMLEATNIDHDTLLKQCPPVEMDNDDLYHASLCSTVVNKSNDTEQCKKLLQSLSYRSLKELSVSQCDHNTAFPRCMIAVNSDQRSNATTCYVAFKNISEFKDWEILSDAQKSTFGKVLECQIEKFPTLYLETVIKSKYKLVLTGFSFGGVLAQMLAAQLWLLPQTHTDQLMSNVICISFGQPLIQSDLLTHVAESFPDFKDNVHAIGSEVDGLPYIMEKLDQLVFMKEVRLSNILVHLSRMQEFYSSQEFPARNNNTVELPCTTPKAQPLTASGEGCAVVPTQCDGTNEIVKHIANGDESALIASPKSKVSDSQKEIERLLRSQHDDMVSATSFAAKRHLITCSSDSGLKLIEMSERLEESLRFNRKADLIRPKSFDEHTAGVYYRFIKKLAYNHRQRELSYGEISSKFLCPSIEQVKVTQYGKDAIVVVTGHQLWFVHSIKRLTAVYEPFQLQEACVSFKADMNDFIPTDDRKNDEVVIFSHFSVPVTKKYSIELNPDGLSPRGKQLASLEPARLLELAFMMALLERSPNRFQNCSSPGNPQVYIGEITPFFNFFKQFLHDLVSVAPFESILCTIAHYQNKRTVELCTRVIKKLEIDFEFSLTTYASLFVAAFKAQHQNKSFESSVAQFLDKQPYEDCAYFMWVKAKYLKSVSSKASVNSFSDEVFTDPYIFGSQEVLCSEALYLQSIVQHSLEEVNSLSEVNAVSNKTAADLYKWSRVDPSSKSKQGLKSIKSPISVLVEGREVLHQNNDLPSHQHGEETNSRRLSYDKTMEVMHNARGAQFDLCIGVLCGFMYQHVRVPFTEFNPMTFWKSLRHHIAPYSDVFKNDTEFWISILKRCQRAISKGSQVAERTYDAKLKFLVTNIDPETKAHTTPISSEYSMYTLEKKLKELCTKRGIMKEKPIERIVSDWKFHFVDCPMEKVALSHQTLISQWIKWSLLLHELRLTLEEHVTIAIPGLVNSGKTQLIRSLFGLDVKAGTTELRRTIVPFMYSLAPDVKGVHVVDLPGADDSDKNVSQLTDLLKFISQIVVFVVSYDKAHTKDAKKWLDLFEKNEDDSHHAKKMTDDYNVISDNHFESSRHRNDDSSKVPVLVCMTFADRLLAEMLDEDGKYHEERTKKAIAKHFDDISDRYYGQGMWAPKGKRTLGYYCFNLSQSRLEEKDVKAVGIGVPSDVGDWICNQLREEIHESDTAEKLNKYFKKSSRQLRVQ